MKERAPYRTATVTLPPGLLDQLDALAEAEARTRSNMTAIAIKEMLERRAALAQRDGAAER